MNADNENRGYVPKLGADGKASFPQQFIGRLDILSLSATPIEYLDAHGEKISPGNASGFFYKNGGKTYLVSARHALTGLNTFTDKPVSGQGYLPAEIMVRPFVREPSGFHGRREVTLRIRSEGWRPLWKEDPRFADFRTDIAAIELTEPYAPFVDTAEAMMEDRLMSHVGFDCYILGYPNPNFSDPYLPIWRKGSFAYEPTEPIDDKPMFLVDASTSPGMSGGLIVQRWHGPAPLLMPSGEVEIATQNIVTTRIVGVYGGRLSHNFQLAEIGYGWYANRIPLILSA